MKVFLLFTLLALGAKRCTCQSLVLAGGGLEETNVDVWNKIIELAVGMGGQKAQKCINSKIQTHTRGINMANAILKPKEVFTLKTILT